MADYVLRFYNGRSNTKCVFEHTTKSNLKKAIKYAENYFKDSISGNNLDSIMPNKKCTLCIIFSAVEYFKVAGVELRGKKIETVILPVSETYTTKIKSRSQSWK